MTEELHDEYQVCYKHPDRKTLLRCNKCGKPICPECAVQTPTGYRCKDCIKSQQKVFDTAEGKDYIIGAAIAAVLGFLGAFLFQMITFLPAYITALIISVACGRLICAAVRAAVNKRRSSNLTKTVAAAAGVGALLGVLQNIIVNINIMSWGATGFELGCLIQIIIDIAYIVILCGTILAEMSGMVFRR